MTAKFTECLRVIFDVSAVLYCILPLDSYVHYMLYITLLTTNLTHIIFIHLNVTTHMPWIKEQFTKSAFQTAGKQEKGKCRRENSGRIEFKASGTS